MANRLPVLQNKNTNRFEKEAFISLYAGTKYEMFKADIAQTTEGFPTEADKAHMPLTEICYRYTYTS